MMKLHYIDDYKEVNIPEIIYRIMNIRVYEDIEEMIEDSYSWTPMLIEIIDDAIISQLNLNETIKLEDIFKEDDLANIREEILDRLEYLFK